MTSSSMKAPHWVLFQAGYWVLFQTGPFHGQTVFVTCRR
jgi:hypothetical protein